MIYFNNNNNNKNPDEYEHFVNISTKKYAKKTFSKYFFLT